MGLASQRRSNQIDRFKKYVKVIAIISFSVLQPAKTFVMNLLTRPRSLLSSVTGFGKVR